MDPDLEIELANARSGAILVDNTEDRARQREQIEGFVREMISEVGRLEDLISGAGDALRIGQPAGAGVVDVRWWKTRTLAKGREPLLVRWEFVSLKKPVAGVAHVVKPRPIRRYVAVKPREDGLALRNHDRIVELVGIVQDAIKRRDILLGRIYSVTRTLRQSITENGYKTTEALAKVSALRSACLREALKESGPV